MQWVHPAVSGLCLKTSLILYLNNGILKHYRTVRVQYICRFCTERIERLTELSGSYRIIILTARLLLHSTSCVCVSGSSESSSSCSVDVPPHWDKTALADFTYKVR